MPGKVVSLSIPSLIPQGSQGQVSPALRGSLRSLGGGLEVSDTYEGEDSE